MEDRYSIFDNERQAPRTFEEKEDILGMRSKIESELSFVKVIRNENDEIINEDGLISAFQDEHTYRYINTTSFKNWYHGPFSERNEPIPFYHAAGEYFDKFDPGKMYSSRGFLNLGAGFYVLYEERDLSLYIDIARGKEPEDEIRRKKMLDIGETITHFRSAIQILKEKHEAVFLTSLDESKILQESISQLEEQLNLFFDRLDLDYIESIRFEGRELSFSDKIKLHFDGNKKEFYALFLAFKKLQLSLKEKNDFANKIHDAYLAEVHNYQEAIQEKQKERAKLMPKGAILEIFANVNSILDFNDPIDEAKLVEVKNTLKRNGYDELSFDRYLLEDGSHNGESLYKALSRIITGKKLKHHLDLEMDEKQVDTRPVSDFLSGNKIYDASRYTVLDRTYTAPFGQKTLIVYDTNDLLILPETAVSQ